MKKQKDNRMFLSKGAIIDDGILWMLTEMTDVLLAFDMETMKLKKWIVVPGIEWMQCGYMAMLKSSKGIYAIPFYGEGVYLFDNFGGVRKIPIPDENCFHATGKFLISGVWKNDLAIVGHGVNGIFFYNEVTQKVEKKSDYLTMIAEAGYDNSIPLFSDEYCQVGSSLYIPIYKTNAILKTDIESRTNELIQLEASKVIRIRTIDNFIRDGKNYFLLTTCDDESLIWSPKKGIEEFKKMDLLNGNEKIYHRAYHINEKRYYISALERKVFVDTGVDVFELRFDYELDGAVSELDHTQFEAVFKSNDNIFFQARSNGQLFRIDTTKDIITRVDFNISVEEKRKIILNLCAAKKMISTKEESNLVDLELFLGILGKGGGIYAAQSNDSGCGRSPDRWRVLLYD